MAQSTNATTKDLSDSRGEALSAILQSLSPDTTQFSTGTDGKLSTDQVRKLSDRLGQILGDQAETGEATRRNEKGELINEEGLPIVDINEPVHTADIAFRPDPEGHFDDPDLLPLWTLSPAEKARRRSERERILDLLEEEERIQEQRDVDAAREHYQQEMEKRKEAARTEIENLKRARELQKKMGRALIRSVVESRDKEEKEKEALAEQDRLTAERKTPKTKKSVTFAEDVGEDGIIKSSDTPRTEDWGDVAPATLHSNDVYSAGRRDPQPMKLRVVERHPRGFGSALQSTPDSDDESDPGSSAVVTDDLDSESGFLGDSQTPDSEASDEDLPRDEEISEWNDEDLDYAQHQREIALEYYKKRQTMGVEAASAMRAHTHGEDEWDQPEVPLEATLSSPPPKSSVSRFKAERLAHGTSSQNSLASHSLGSSIVPSSTSNSMKRAVRMGKLENGQLIGGNEGDSEDEVIADDENAQEMLELLKKGNMTNVGPASEIVANTHSATTKAPVPSTSEDSSSMPQPQSLPPKVSKFKLSLGQLESSYPSPPGTPASTLTPTDLANRSSPKPMSSRGGTPDVSAPSAILQQSRFTLPPELQAAYANGEIQAQMPGMIVDSPSFMAPRAAVSGQGLTSPSLTLSPTSTVVPSPTSTTSPFSASTIGAAGLNAPTATPMRHSVVERRPPTVTSVAADIPAQPHTAVPKPRVSRFKAQRS